MKSYNPYIAIMEKYLKIFNLSVIHTLKTYKVLLGLAFFLIICLIIFSNLWEVIAARMEIFDLDPTMLLWYIALNECVIIAIPHPEREIENDLRNGKLAYSLPRPMSYLWGAFYESFGAYAVNFTVLGAIASAFAWLQAGGVPVPLWVVPIFVITGFLAGALAILFQMLLGVGSFWIHEVEPLTWIWEKLLFALGGLLFPLSVYPKILQKIAALTPFPYILGGRSALVIDYSFNQILHVIIALTFWIFVAIGALSFLYRRGLKIINIEGG